MNAQLGRMLSEPPSPEIDDDTICEAQELLLDDHAFLAAFVVDNNEVNKLFEREVLRKAADLHDLRQEAAFDASIGNRDEE
jgi:hypothetical protein